MGKINKESLWSGKFEEFLKNGNDKENFIDYLARKFEDSFFRDFLYDGAKLIDDRRYVEYEEGKSILDSLAEKMKKEVADTDVVVDDLNMTYEWIKDADTSKWLGRTRMLKGEFKLSDLYLIGQAVDDVYTRKIGLTKQQLKDYRRIRMRIKSILTSN